MKHLFRSALVTLSLSLILIAPAVMAEQVILSVGGIARTHAVDGAFQQAHLLITGPAGQVFEQKLDTQQSSSFNFNTSGRPEGHYNYRIDFVGTVAQASNPSQATNSEGRAVNARAGIPAPPAQTGVFLWRNGQVIFPQEPTHGGRQDIPTPVGAKTSQSGLNKSSLDKVVFLEDVIVDGSICAGFDCVNGESFGFDTIRVKENNLRIKFEDTSATASFPTNDWQLTANDTANGGAEKFSIDDITNGRTPFTVEANAPNDSLYVEDGGRIGFGTSTPVVELHTRDGDSPTLRLEQDGSSGFTQQTWDVAGNEANFFIRDATNGSTLVFRIEPGAGSNSLYIEADSDVGLGTTSPDAKLDVDKSTPAATPIPMIRVTNAHADFSASDRFEVDSNGNVSARGTISQLSSRSAKEALALIDGQALLSKISNLPIFSWQYLTAADRHVGPVAEDFYQAFGLGNTDKMIAPSDMAGVALAAVQALQTQLQQRDQQIADLEKRLQQLEARNRE